MYSSLDRSQILFDNPPSYGLSPPSAVITFEDHLTYLMATLVVLAGSWYAPRDMGGGVEG